ncbi:MAG: glycosyltransferase family 39 protein, partial [Anaerolineae bacterium]|nr:glycosyltransferase family 39 protein [Anaerolineae bacterium]
MVKADKLRHNLLIVAVLLVAFGLRMAAINSIPAGLSHDEAYNGVTAMQTLDGQYQVFYEINKGIEPLIIYIEALAFRAFGIGPVQLRLVNVMAGMLTIALVYPLTARLFNRRVALLAMAGLSISFWAVFVSRLTLRAVLLPPLLLLTLYLFWRALPTRSHLIPSPPNPPANPPTNPLPPQPQPIQPINHPTSHPTNQQTNKPTPKLLTLTFFALSGLAAGITMYTYLSSRFVPFIVLTVFGCFWLRRHLTKWHWVGLLLHFMIWAAIFTPLLSYFIEHQASFSRRADQVSTIPYLLNGEFGPTLRNTGRTLGMFTFEGDTTDRYNLNGRPVFDWVNGLLFYFGLGLLLWRLPRSLRTAGPAVLLLSTLFFMLLPDFITDDSPHFLRTIGALPIVYIVWAVALDTAIRLVERRLASGQLRPTQASTKLITSSLLLLLLLLTAAHTGYDYFVRWANSPEARQIYGADIAAVARYLKQSESHDLPVISAEYYRDLDP